MKQAPRFDGLSFDTSRQSFFKKFPLRGDQPMLTNTGIDPLGQFFGGAGLSVETKDVALVDRVDGGLLIGIAGQHDAGGVWRLLFEGFQRLHTIHTWHTHVTDDDCERSLLFVRVQRCCTAFGGYNMKLPMQLAAKAGEQPNIVIHD